MPFEIVRNDITNMKVDAIVNTANPRPVIGSGTDAAIHAKAGPMLLLRRRLIGPMDVGSACITPGFRLPARYVIHTVGPVWQGGLCGEERLLRQCYVSCLELARKKKLRSVAFPLISSGNYGFPKDLALDIAADAIREFLTENEMDVYLVVFSRQAVLLSKSRQQDIRSFIDEHYVQEAAAKEYSFSVRTEYEPVRQIMEEPPEKIYEDAVFAPAPEFRPEDEFDGEMDWWDIPTLGRDNGAERTGSPERELLEQTVCGYCPAPEDDRAYAPEEACAMPLPAAAPRPAPKQAVPKAALSLEDMLRRQDAGFSDRLLQLIDETGRKDSEIYRRANVSRQHFSKIRNNPAYKPTKSTALAFAIALELDLDKTRDLIGRAGFALTNSSKADLIIMYFIEKRNYNIVDINMALFEFDQSLLGA